MEIAQQTGFEIAAREIKSYDLNIMLGYSIFACVLLIGIYFSSLSSGTAPGDFVSMVAFP